MRKLNISKLTKIALLLITVLTPFSNRAQNTGDTKKKMIEIKLNDAFIFGEGIGDDKELAYGEALDDLLAFANELKDMNSQEKIGLSDLITNVETLVYEEGSRFEVMVYIPFKIVIETDKKTSSAKEEIKKSQGTTSGSSVVEKSVAQVPVTHQASVVNEEPAIVEAPAITEASVVTETVVAPELAVVTQTPVAEEVPVVIEETVTVTETLPAPIAQVSKEGDEIEDFLISQENFSEIKPYLSDMKKSGKIKETGAVDAADSAPADSTVILIDELGGLLSVLSPVKNGERINYKTKKTDSEKNYNSRFIVWYRK